MNIETPEALRERARTLRESASRALDAADEDDIRADALDSMFAAEVEQVLAQGKLDAAKNREEHNAAAFELVDTVLDAQPITDAIMDPLNLQHFTGGTGWLTRLERPEVYRAVLLAKAEGRIVPDAAFETAVAAARRSRRYDAELIGDLDSMGGL